MTYWQLISPLIALVVSIGAGAKLGDYISKRTGRKVIGWTAGIVVFLLLFTLSAWVTAAPRSHAARAAFQHANPCPATGKPRGACPGYVVDHIKPLCAGGSDRPDNMQWQSVPEAKEKDREERRLCSSMKKSRA